MEKFFIGIDVSNEFFDYCIINQQTEVLLRGQEDNTKHGIEQFVKVINRFKTYSPWICMEHTGYYGYLLSYMFSKKELLFSLINPLELKRSMGLTRGKTDKIDAYRIAVYAHQNQFKLKPYKLPIQVLGKLKVLMKTRNLYVKTSTQLKNNLKGMAIAAKTIDLRDVIEQQEKTIQDFAVKIKQIENEIIRLIKSCEELNESYKKISLVIGVGPITAAQCIIETQNFTKFTDARKFSCHCGLAPFEYSSGTSIKGKTRTSPLCNKPLKGILYKAACSAIQHDPQLKAYYNRKLADGKHKLSVLNAVAYKIVLRIFAVQKRNEPFVKLCA